MEKLIVAVGLNENVSKAANPNVPASPDEIAEDVAACVEAGATVIHLHARHPVTGAPSMDDPEIYLETFRAITARTDSLVYPTYPLGGVVERYRHVVALGDDPDVNLEIAPIIAGSADLTPGPSHIGEYGGGDFCLHHTLDDLLYQLAWAREHDLWVSHDVMEPGGVRVTASLFALGLYVRPVLYKFFMSERWGIGFPPEPRYLDVYASLIPEDVDAEWLVLPMGVPFRQSMALWSHAITNGGHVRVGVGDNPDIGDGFLPTNAERVAQMVELAHTLGREVATLDDVRARFAPFGAAAAATPNAPTAVSV